MYLCLLIFCIWSQMEMISHFPSGALFESTATSDSYKSLLSDNCLLVCFYPITATFSLLGQQWCPIRVFIKCT